MKTSANLTAETITKSQIDALRKEAHEAGDHDQVLVCDIATAPSYWTDRELIGPDGNVWTRTAARAACADAINDARTAG